MCQGVSDCPQVGRVLSVYEHLVTVQPAGCLYCLLGFLSCIETLDYERFTTFLFQKGLGDMFDCWWSPKSEAIFYSKPYSVASIEVLPLWQPEFDSSPHNCLHTKCTVSGSHMTLSGI